MTARPLTGGEIITLVAEVADHLAPEGPQLSLVLVGGSLLAWRGLRETTDDVDSVRRVDAELKTAIAHVADHHDLPPDWLNDNAAMFMPATFEASDCEILLERPRLVVLGAPLEMIFVMKLYRAQPNDRDDMVKMWPELSFTSRQEVVTSFFAAFPHAPEDPYLGEFVGEIAALAGCDVLD